MFGHSHKHDIISILHLYIYIYICGGDLYVQNDGVLAPQLRLQPLQTSKLGLPKVWFHSWTRFPPNQLGIGQVLFQRKKVAYQPPQYGIVPVRYLFCTVFSKHDSLTLYVTMPPELCGEACFPFCFCFIMSCFVCFSSYQQHLELEAAISNNIYNIFELKPLIFSDTCVTCVMPCAHTCASLCVLQHKCAVQ